MQTGRPRAHIVTYGCQMNENDSEILAAYLEELGYELWPSQDESDLILVNTCAVRETAEQRALGRLHELKRLKEERPQLFLGVTGCVPQQPGRAEEIARAMPHLNLVFGTHNLHRFPDLYQAGMGRTIPLVEIAGEPDELPVFPRGIREGGVTAWVTILRGCDKRCTYCIVPYVRGREMSRPIAEIAQEVEALCADGVREVTLLGQNVNAYGHDLMDQPTNFATLLRRLDTLPGLSRIRYTTSHPRDFTQEMIDAIASSNKVCEHFHLPVQSGSNYMLKRMARGYQREKFLDLVRRVREGVPQATITTDLIVGFPGESDRDFEDTLDLVREVQFDKAFTFMFSPRRGTPAAEFPDQVPLALKKERLARLMEVQDALTLQKNLERVGQVREVLVEGPSRKNPGRLFGRTRGGRIVVFVAPPDLTGKLVDVRITRANTWTLEGECVAQHLSA